MDGNGQHVAAAAATERDANPRLWVPYAVSAVVCAIAFLFDATTPLGVAAGVLYVALVLTGAWLPRSGQIFVLALIGSMLTMAVYVIDHETGTTWTAAVNRGLALFAIWVSAALLHLRRRAEDDLRRAHDELEHRVRERTRELDHEIGERKIIEQRLRTLLENVADAIITMGANGIVNAYNKAAAEVFQYAADEVIGRNIKMLMPEPHRGRHDDYLRAYARTGKRHIVGAVREVMAQRKDGTIFPLEISVNETRVGEEVLFIGVARDLTGKREAETAILQAYKMESLGNLAGGIAHDINNMLMPILNITRSAIASLPESRPERKSLGLVLRAAEQVRDLVTKIISFSRQDTTDKDFVDIAELMRETLELVRSTLPATIRLVAQVDPNTGFVIASPPQISTVLLNLISNARDAMAGNIGTLSVRLAADRAGASEAGGSARIYVTDTGRGMDDKTVKRIFDPFFTTKDVDKGTGLGMAMVYGIVADHGGKISVRSAPGAGTSVEIALPLAWPAAAAMSRIAGGAGNG